MTDREFPAHPDLGPAFALELSGPVLLGHLLDRLPPSISHITFDPGPRARRRYPLADIRSELGRDAQAA
jgi:hypothetical protein